MSYRGRGISLYRESYAESKDGIWAMVEAMPECRAGG